MAKLTISDAARVAGVARSTLHRAIKHGRLSVDPDGHIDTAELLRAGYTLQRSTQQNRSGALQDATPRSKNTQQASIPAETQASTIVQQERDVLRLERDMLQRELEAAQSREQAAYTREQTALEREHAARDREALLLHMLQQMQHRYDRLLEAPRPAPTVGIPTAPGVSPQRLPAPTAAEDVDRGTTRRRILALLQEHPEGLSTTEIRILLGMKRRLTNTCTGMARDGLLQRVGRGRYRACTV